MQPDCDVVIVGAGIVGLTLAVALKRAGLKLMVIDGRGPVADKAFDDVRGLALARSSENLLRSLDLWSALEPYTTPVHEIEVSDRGHFGATRLRAEEGDLDALGFVCPADRLLQEVERGASASVDVRWHTHFTGIDSGTPWRSVHLNTQNGNEIVTTRLLIGADGVDSKVCEFLETSVHTRDYGQSAIVANLNAERVRANTAYERFTDSGTVALLPVGAGRCVSVRCAAADAVNELRAIDDEKYLAEFATLFGGRLGRLSNLGNRRAHPLKLRLVEQPAGDRIVLLGAAATSVHPNAAQGLNLGLRDVAVFAAYAREARQSDIGAPGLVAAYTEARRQDRKDIARATDTIAQAFASTLLPLRPCAALRCWLSIQCRS